MNENNNKNGMPEQGGSGKGNGDAKLFVQIIIVSLVLIFAVHLLDSGLRTRAQMEVKYSDFVTMVKEGKVEEIEIKSDRIVIYPKASENINIFEPRSTTTYYTGYIRDDSLIALLEDNGVKFSAPVEQNSLIMQLMLSWIMPMIMLGLLFFFLNRFISKKLGSGGVMGVGKSNAKVYMQKETGVTFKDVAGQDEAKESLEEIVDFLHNPEKYAKIGAKQPKGALLVGPPGTGKTLLAKAVAGEADVTFLSITGSDFVEMFVGVGASRVRDLFKQAQENAPCIVFIDEIDAIGKSRDNGIGGSNDEREQTLNQLLSEMDGFDASTAVVILAATNRPEVLDKALLRPGRFDRRIIVEKPDLPGREKILQVHAAKVKLGSDVDLNKIALATGGAAGADLANMVNEAALRAVRMGREEVMQEDLMEAVEVVIAGKEKKDRVMSETERKVVAFHEVGHALAAAKQKHTQPVQKITIVPRTMGSLGYTMQMPEEEKYLMTKDEILAEIVILLAGRSAEEVVFNQVTTGASNDIERATSLARSMISQYGMSDSFDMMALESVQNRYLDGRPVTTCGDLTIAQLDKEVLEVIKSCHAKALDIIKTNREALDKISDYLITRETITGEEFMKILNEADGVEVKEEIKEEVKEETTEDKGDLN
jgi:cell division protease FtsH